MDDRRPTRAERALLREVRGSERRNGSSVDHLTYGGWRATTVRHCIEAGWLVEGNHFGPTVQITETGRAVIGEGPAPMTDRMTDARNNPWLHDFTPPCGSQEGRDSCWLCGRARADHTLPEVPGWPRRPGRQSLG